MRTHILADGTITQYDNHVYMNRHYANYRARYRARVMCPDCNTEYTYNNKYNHMHSKLHIKKVAEITNAVPEPSNDTPPLDERHKHF